MWFLLAVCRAPPSLSIVAEIRVVRGQGHAVRTYLRQGLGEPWHSEPWAYYPYNAIIGPPRGSLLLPRYPPATPMHHTRRRQYYKFGPERQARTHFAEWERPPSGLMWTLLLSTRLLLTGGVVGPGGERWTLTFSLDTFHAIWRDKRSHWRYALVWAR